MKNIPHQLSAEAIQNLRAIYEEEFDDVLTDDEFQEMGMRLLRFFSIIAKKDDGEIQLTEQESVAFKHIHDCICHHGRQPTVRSIAEAIGRRSPRSGFRVLDILMKRQIVWRNETGEICMVEGHCDFWKCPTV